MSDLMISTAQDAEDLAWGACFYGIGGGGPVSEGVRLLQKALAEHGPVRCLDPDSFPDDAYVATVSFMGNRAPLSLEQEEEKRRCGLLTPRYENNLVEALKFLEASTGKTISGIVPSELGGANAPGPLSVALQLGLTPLNGDYTGKAKPEAAQGAPCLLGYDMVPLATVDKWGNKAFIREAVNNTLAERIGKMLAVAAFGNTAMACFLLPGSVMKKAIFPGTLTECANLGKALRQGRENGQNAVETALRLTNGRLLFEGVVVKKQWGVPGGYYTGTHELAGSGAFSGHTYKVWFKNENHIAWLDGKAHATTPDRIGQISMDTGRPIMTQEIEQGDRIAFIGLAAHPRHLEAQALPFMEPRHYGFDLDYTPLSDLCVNELDL